MKECVVILGMHRSGTSVLSGLVSHQGFYLGSDEMPVREDNPKGFFENMRIYRLNQTILEDYKTSWDTHSFTCEMINSNDFNAYKLRAKKIIKEEFGLVKRIFIKDPRMCLLFPLWEKALKEMGFTIKVILAYRSPMEVAHSLRSRNKIDVEKSLMMWSHYLFQAEKKSRSYRRLLVKYSDDFFDLDTFVGVLGEFLEVDITESIRNAAHALYTPQLKHHQLGFDSLSHEIPSYLKEFILILQMEKLDEEEPLDKVTDEFYYSQKFFLYDDSRKLDEIIGLKKNLSKVERDSKQNLSDMERESKKSLQALVENHQLRLKLKDEESERKIQESKALSDRLIRESKQKFESKILVTEQISELKLSQVRDQFRGQFRDQTRKLEKVKSESERYKKKVATLEGKVEALNREIQKLQNIVKKSEARETFSQSVFSSILSSPSLSKKLRALTGDGRYFKRKRALQLPSRKKARRILQEKALIIESGLFSPFYYLVNNPDVWHAQVDPLRHFCNEGWREGRNPGPMFNVRDYLDMYDDVAHSSDNPLLHYIKFGKSEGRNPFKKAKSKKLILSDSRKKEGLAVQTESVQGESLIKEMNGIHNFESGYVLGGFISENAIPIVNVNGVPANLVNFDRSDNSIAHEAITSVHQEANIELLSLTEEGIVRKDTKSFAQKNYIRDKYADLEKAFEICSNADAVAITVWEGSHNPIGRAKVLYDVITTKRPAVIFAYTFGGFGKDIWKPLKSAGLNVVLIPYAERQAYYNYIQRRNVKFNTVWICKHRLHSFELASMISKPETACILDMDDNEDVFVSSKGSEFQPYGIFSKNKSDYFLKRIPTRSVASVSLKNKYGGMLVRHARKVYEQERSSKREDDTLAAAFIGTIRQHKNIVGLVSAVSTFNESAPEKIKLAIGGDFNPPSLRNTLNKPHTIILDSVSSDSLFDTLVSYDVVITGYPGEDKGSEEINKYQITSKIGDGLATGKAVLTPHSPAVDDLHEIPGLFIFTTDDFGKQLQRALDYNKRIDLPEEFTLDYSYDTFKQLERAAKKESIASYVFELEPFYQLVKPIKENNKNIVLIWKQHDAGIYGRRIDQIARYYKQKNPESNVTVIEVISERQLSQMMDSKNKFDNSTVIINEKLSNKIYQYTDEGVVYRLITHNDNAGWNSFHDKFTGFLRAEAIYPSNSVIIIFPLHNVFESLLKVLNNYKLIVDLVDNQIKWMTSSEGRLKGLKQYYELISIADEVVANSPENISYFESLGFFKQIEPKVIANWYTLPESLEFGRKVAPDGGVNLIYSGNLNDRIDWSLLGKICNSLLGHNGFLHIAGSTIRRPEEMKKLLEFPNCIYHGVVSEVQLLRLLQHMDFAVMPHVEDDISKFMDPIKLKMYKKLGLVSLSSKLPGLPTRNPFIVVADSSDEFLVKLEKMLCDCKKTSFSSKEIKILDETAENYSILIEKLFNDIE